MTHVCPICDVPFKLNDECATDITEGTCHAACLEGSPVVNLETGDEMPDGKIDTFLYEDEPFMVREITIDEGDEPRRWVDLMVAAACKKGGEFFRVSYEPENERHMLFEAWRERPNDQGPQRWGACK
jgi:hypothetical protein